MGLEHRFVLHRVSFDSDPLTKGTIVFRSKEPIPTFVTIECSDKEHLKELIAAREFFITVEDADECICEPDSLGPSPHCPRHRPNCSTPEDLGLMTKKTPEEEQ